MYRPPSPTGSSSAGDPLEAIVEDPVDGGGLVDQRVLGCCEVDQGTEVIIAGHGVDVLPDQVLGSISTPTWVAPPRGRGLDETLRVAGLKTRFCGCISIATRTSLSARELVDLLPERDGDLVPLVVEDLHVDAAQGLTIHDGRVPQRSATDFRTS